MGIDAIGGVSGAYNTVPTTQTTSNPQPTTVEPTAPEKPEASQANTETAENSYAQGGSTFDITDSGRQEISQTTDVTEALKKAVEDINRNAVHSEAQFAVHEATNRIMVKIVDKQTKEVIKEFPPEKTLDIIAKAWELAGLTVDERR